MQVQAETGAW